MNRLRYVALTWARPALAALLLVTATVLVVRAIDARSLPDLEIWHGALLDAEFTAESTASVATLKAYLDTESATFRQVRERVYAPVQSAADSRLNRYLTGSRSDPRRFERNWNRTFEMRPDEIRGGVLLVHGLTDSPYSVRHLAGLLFDGGYYVLGLRMPGHGTIPGALLTARWQDWAAAVALGARHVLKQLPDDAPFLLGGYSNGGALVLNYTLDALRAGDHKAPDQLILISPMLGVSRYAFFSNWHETLSWMSFFEKFKWVDVYPEYDPFKYNSFPKAAGRQSYLLVREIVRKLETLGDADRAGELPPILAFQSLVDATVSTEALVHQLFDRLQAKNNELVLFDINHTDMVRDFVNPKYDRAGLLASLSQRDALPYTLTLVTNAGMESPQVVARSRPEGESKETETALGLSWPSQVYSLSHVALPFPPDDAVYGVTSENGALLNINIGMIQPRGEKNVLNVPLSLLLRLRYNPFFSYLKHRVADTGGRHSNR